jgi:hypothetical protein
LAAAQVHERSKQACLTRYESRQTKKGAAAARSTDEIQDAQRSGESKVTRDSPGARMMMSPDDPIATQQKYGARIETDPKSLADAWKKTLKVKCPHCGEMHRVSSVKPNQVCGPGRLRPDCRWQAAQFNAMDAPFLRVTAIRFLWFCVYFARGHNNAHL